MLKSLLKLWAETDRREKSVRKSVWSRWLNYIRGYWCGRMKSETNSLDIYTRALSADVFDIPIEPKSTITRTKMTIPEDCTAGFAQSRNDSCSAVAKAENPRENEADGRLMRYSDDLRRVTGGKHLMTSRVFYAENADRVVQRADLAFPRFWSHSGTLRNANMSNRNVLDKPIYPRKTQISELQDISRTSSEPTWNKKVEIYRRQHVKAGINNLFDQLMSMQQDCYETEYKKPKERKRLQLDTESSEVSQKRSTSYKISRQVSPAVLVNIKPFKRQITQNDLHDNFSTAAKTSKLNLNQIKKTKRLEVEKVEKEAENFELRCPALKNQVITLRNFWDAEKEKPALRKEAPEHQDPETGLLGDPLNKDFCFVVGLYRSCNEVRGEMNGKSLDDVLENLDGRDHNVVFKKNMRQFRKKIISGSIKGEEKETGRRELKLEKGKEEHKKIESIPTMLMKSEVILGIIYDLATDYSIVRLVSFVGEEIHTVTMLQTVRENHQCHESHFGTVIEKRFSNLPILPMRELREIRVEELKTARILHKLQYYLRNVEGVGRVIWAPMKKATNICFIIPECSAPEQPEPVELRENVSDLMGAPKECSTLPEKSGSDDDVIEIEKIFIETGTESGGASLNLNVLVENLTHDHRAVQILNNSALEYLALIYQTGGPRKCSGKSFSESDLHKKRKQAIILNSEMSILKDFVWKDFGRRRPTPTPSLDSQRLYNDLESLSDDDDNEAPEDETPVTENALQDKTNADSSVSSLRGKRMCHVPVFKSSSFPGEITTARDSRAQKSRLFKDFHKDVEKKIKSIEKGLGVNKGGNFDCWGPEKPIKIESDSARFQKYLAPDQLKSLNDNKKMFFIEPNAGELKKEVIAAFSTIKDLSEEKDSTKTSVVIMLSRK